jgi:Bacterial SH3 domain
MRWSGDSKFIAGFIAAIVFLFLAGASLTHSLLALLVNPDPNIPSTLVPASSIESSVTDPAVSAPASASPLLISPNASPSLSPLPSPQSYQAKVQSLIPITVREAPQADATSVGSIEYNQEVLVLGNSPDGVWQKIRSNTAEGWVRSGNVQPIN